MAAEQFTTVQFSNIVTPPVRIHVMVVDGDATSLVVVAGLLKTLNYKVTSFNDPIRALYTLRARKQSFDLIITDLHMTKMDGFELTRRVDEEFKLPVIMISSDVRESVMFRAIQEGVVLYLLKPFTLNDLRNIWQFAIFTKSRGKINPRLFVEETGSEAAEFPAFKADSEEAISVSSANKGRREEKKDSKKGGKGKNQEKGNDKTTSATPKKKAKVVWIDFLQYRFLQAVHYIGLDKAVPKKILEVMNVPGLTRENVASHLQKYRIFLKKVAERCMLASDKTTEQALWSKFLSRHASLMLKKIQQKNAGFLSQQQPQQKGILRSRGAKTRHAGPDQNPKSPFSGNSNNFLTNRTSGFGSYGRSTSFIGSANPMQMDRNQAQDFNFGNPGIEATYSYFPQFQDLAYFNNSYPSYPSNNYAGLSVGIDGKLSVMGGTRNCNKGISNRFDFVDGMPNGNFMSFEPKGVGNSGCFAGGSLSSAWNANPVPMQRDQHGLGIGENSYNLDSIFDAMNFANDSQQEHYNDDVSGSSHALMDLDNQDGGQEDEDLDLFASLFPLESFFKNQNTNKQQGTGDFMEDDSHHLYNMYAADEEIPTSPFSVDDQVLDEFLESFLGNDTSEEE